MVRRGRWFLSSQETKTFEDNKIIKQVCRKYDVSKKDLFRRSPKKAAQAKREVMFRLHCELNRSVEYIQKLFGFAQGQTIRISMAYYVEAVQRAEEAAGRVVTPLAE